MQKSFPDCTAVITDTSCLIILQKINSLDILRQLFSTVITTSEIAKEFGYQLPPWFKIQNGNNLLTESFKSSIDEGEASAIGLALDIENALLIIDDAKARKFAQKLGLSVKGTVGVLLTAKQLGLISELKPLIAAIQDTNFRISSSLLESILRQAGE